MVGNIFKRIYTFISVMVHKVSNQSEGIRLTVGY